MQMGSVLANTVVHVSAHVLFLEAEWVVCGMLFYHRVPGRKYLNIPGLVDYDYWRERS